MSKAKRVTIKLTAKQRGELSRITGEDHAEVMVEAVKAPLGKKSAPRPGAVQLQARLAPAIKLQRQTGKVALRPNVLSAKSAPRPNVLSAKSAPRPNVLSVKRAPAKKF